MKFTLITLVLCMFVLAALTEAGKAGKNKKKGQNNKGGKRLPGVACGLKCKDECNVNKSCKKKCIKSTKGKERKECLKECNGGQPTCFTCKRECFEEARNCMSSNCANDCPSGEENLGPRKYKIKYPKCYQCLVANCLAYTGEDGE